MSKKRKVLLVFLCVFLLLVVPAGVTIFFLMPKFQVREFIEQEQVEYQEAMEYQAGDICSVSYTHLTLPTTRRGGYWGTWMLPSYLCLFLSRKTIGIKTSRGSG